MTKEMIIKEVELAFELFEKTKGLDYRTKERVLRVWNDLMYQEQVAKEIAEKETYAAKLGNTYPHSMAAGSPCQNPAPGVY